jgi:hypothetical protein
MAGYLLTDMIKIKKGTVPVGRLKVAGEGWALSGM